MTVQVIEREVHGDIFGPGLYEGIPAEVYHKWSHASQSRLKVLRDRTPAHLRYEMDHPRESTPAQVLGTAVHTAVLQPDLFAAEYVRGVEGDGRTKAVKEALAALQAEHPLATIVQPDEFDTCLRMRDAVRSHPIARKLLVGEAERSAVWRDADTGVMCKGRFDDIARRAGCIVDLKTTMDASPRRFVRSIFDFGYHLQSAFYLDGAAHVGIGADVFAIIAVEKTPPYCVAVYQVHGDAIAAGQEELAPLLELWAECERSGVWPGYPEQVEEITLAPWAFREIDERVGVS